MGRAPLVVGGIVDHQHHKLAAQREQAGDRPADHPLLVERGYDKTKNRSSPPAASLALTRAEVTAIAYTYNVVSATTTVINSIVSP